ncbi:MAG: BatD family protein [Bacteroidota bacterium]
MTQKLLIFLFVAVWPLCLSAQGPIKFYASSDAKQIVLGGYFQVQFTLENGEGSQFAPPSFKDFSVLSGPSQSSSITSVNGRWSRTVGFSYNLQPSRIGTFTIGAASIVVKGKTYRTKPLRIQVVKGKNSNATTQADLEAQLEEQVFVQAVPVKTEAVIGEQILLDYKLYTTRDIDTYNVSAESDYPGFFVQEIRRSSNGRVIKEVIDGVQYSTTVVRRVSLFPQQAGRLKIDPIAVQASIIVEDGSRRRRGFFYRPKVNRVVLRSEPININVKKLPPNAPPTFTGAVGKYYLSVNTNKAALSTDDAITLTMSVTGNGDIKRIQAPPLLLSDSFEVYEPRVIEENSFESREAITGKKTFEYIILPKEPGRYVLNPVFTYYDSDSLRYIDLQNRSFQIAVSRGRRSDSAPPPVVDDKAGQEDIRFIKTTASFQSSEDSFYGSPLFWSILLFPFVTFGGLLAFQRIQAKRELIDPSILRQRQAQKLAKKRLQQAKGFLDQQNKKAFYEEVSRALFGYVCDKLSIPLSELSKQNVRERLVSLSVDEQLIQRFLTIVQTCEMALFAGRDNAAAMGETYNETLDVIAAMEAGIALDKG